jgi:hypothetical protein
MSIPVSAEYLAMALLPSHAAKETTLAHVNVGDLILPTGKLVACDPFVFPDAEPFEISMPKGTFPILLSVASIKSDQRVAFAIVKFRESIPVAWDMLTAGQEDQLSLKPGEIFGYPVDAGTGCFMDQSTGIALSKTMATNNDFFEEMIAEMEKTYRHTWSWLNMPFGNGNLIAFSSGFGDGVYASYVAFDAEGEIVAVVADFAIL